MEGWFKKPEEKEKKGGKKKIRLDPTCLITGQGDFGQGEFIDNPGEFL